MSDAYEHLASGDKRIVDLALRIARLTITQLGEQQGEYFVATRRSIRDRCRWHSGRQFQAAIDSLVNAGAAEIRGDHIAVRADLGLTQ